MSKNKQFLNILSPVLLAAVLLALYLCTMAPGLSWANYGSDGGDLITAAAVRGVAHPTGYPTYLLIASLFQKLPIGNLAFRTNLMSAIFAVGAALLIYAIVQAEGTAKRKSIRWLSGWIAGASFGAAPLVWSQAVITEVYTLHAFFVALTLFLIISPFPIKKVWRTRLRGLVVGLAIGNHITSIFLVPLIFYIEAYQPKTADASLKMKKRINGKNLARSLLWLLIGVSVYLILPLRATRYPVVNWMNPITPKRFWQLVSGHLYQPYYLHLSMGLTVQRIQALAGLLVKQYGGGGIVIGVASAVILFRPSRLFLSTLWIFVVFSAFAIMYTSADSFLYVIPALISFSIWIGIGVNSIFTPQRFQRFLAVGVFFLLLYWAGLSLANYPSVDASRNNQAESFGQEVMQEAPKNAILFAKGDKSVFALWYFHFALGYRPDLTILATDLLPYDWYQEEVRMQYPELTLPDSSLWESVVISSNPARPACFVEFEEKTSLRCSKNLDD